MLIYLVILFILCIFSFYKDKKILFFISFFILLFIGGLRGLNVGTDTANYYKLYNYGESIFRALKGYEYLYTYLLYFSWKYVKDYQFLVFVSMFLVLLPLYVVIWRESKNINLSVLMYVLTYSWFFAFNGTRQAIAISLCLLAVSFLYKNKKLFFVFILIACLFHTTAIIMLMMFFVDKLYISKVGAVFFILVAMVIGSMSRFLDLNALGIGSDFMYFQYFEREAKDSLSITRILMVIYMCSLILFLDTKNIYVKMMIVGVFLFNLLAFNPSLARISNYFSIAQILVISNMPVKPYIENNKKIILVLALFYGFITFFYFLNANISEVVPYQLYK